MTNWGTPARTIRIEAELWAAVKAKAAQQDTTASETIRALLEGWLNGSLQNSAGIKATALREAAHDIRDRRRRRRKRRAKYHRVPTRPRRTIPKRRQAMSTHEDWAAMKQARDNAAIHAARALVNGDIEHAQKWAAAYDEADTDMHRIRQELDGGK